MKTIYVDDFINKFTYKMDSSNLVKKFLCLQLLYVVIISFALTYNSFIVVGAFATIGVSEIIYMAIACRKKQTIYLATASGIIINCSMVVSFNICLVFILKSIGTFDLIMFTIVLLFQFLSIILGFLYGIKQTKKEVCISTFKWTDNPVTIIMCGFVGRGIYRLISNIENDNIESIVCTLIFAGISLYYMFSLGMSYVTIIYCIKKYKIPDREIDQNLSN